jgi:hypothetical protein
MPKLKSDPINKNDLIDYLDSYSDFSFELSVLKMLRDKDIKCEHGGSYEDPVTSKFREFDIRAMKSIGNYRLRLAIECKNIRENFPVLISCMPRRESESYQQIALVSDPNSNDNPMGTPIFKSRAKTLSIIKEHSIYKPNEPVGKSTVQVGRAFDGTISANDGELYDKWSQSISSSVDLVSRMCWDGDDGDEKDFYLSSVIPIVVVPDGKLWSVFYDDDGNRVREPTPSERCSCFIDKKYDMGSKLTGTKFWISHIEVMTFNGLGSFVDSHMKTEEGISILFSKDGISEALDRF